MLVEEYHKQSREQMSRAAEAGRGWEQMLKIVSLLGIDVSSGSPGQRWFSVASQRNRESKAMKRNRTPGKTKLFPAFPVPAGAPITSEMVREILEPSPLTLRAASIVCRCCRRRR